MCLACLKDNNAPGRHRNQRRAGVPMSVPRSLEHREKLRQVNLGRKITWGNKISATKRGKPHAPHSQSTKKKISEARKRHLELDIECTCGPHLRELNQRHEQLEHEGLEDRRKESCHIGE